MRYKVEMPENKNIEKAPWGALLQGHKHYAVSTLLLAIGYLAVWYAEKLVRKVEQDAEPKGYQGMRSKLTFSVIVMHGLALVS